MDARFSFALQLAVRAGFQLGDLFTLPIEKLYPTAKAADGMTPKTIIDTTISRWINDGIKTAYPHDQILDEEGSASPGSSDWEWIIDPFDGTSNKMPRFPLSVIGITIARNGECVFAAVANPFEKTVTFAEKGAGAFVAPLTVNAENEARRIRVISGRPFHERFAEVDSLWNEKTCHAKAEFLVELGRHVMNVRSFGSNILAWTHLAQGRIEVSLMDAVGGFWDIAPGLVLVSEAGGLITDNDGNHPTRTTQLILATNGELHDLLLPQVAICYQDYQGFR